MWERNIDWLPLAHTPIGDGTCNLGMYPNWESNPGSFGSWLGQCSKQVSHISQDVKSDFYPYLLFFSHLHHQTHYFCNLWWLRIFLKKEWPIVANIFSFRFINTYLNDQHNGFLSISVSCFLPVTFVYRPAFSFWSLTRCSLWALVREHHRRWKRTDVLLYQNQRSRFLS